MDIQEKIVRFISEKLLNGQATLHAENDLLGTGMLDSMGMMWLIAFIEEDFGLKIPLEDITIENFRTIQTIEAYLKRRNGQG